VSEQGEIRRVSLSQGRKRKSERGATKMVEEHPVILADKASLPVERPLNRRRFVRRIGVTLAAAAGVSALLPGKALAFNNCCPNNTQCSGTCGTGFILFYCDCGGGGQSYCTCHANTGCYMGGC
jgi:hypothetical protein